MTIEDYLMKLDQRLTYIDRREKQQIMNDLRLDLEQAKEDYMDDMSSDQAETEAVKSFTSPDEMANAINENYFQAVDEQFSGSTFVFSIVLSLLYMPFGVMLMPFITGAMETDLIVPYLVFMIIAAAVLVFYFKGNLTAEKLRTLSQILTAFKFLPIIVLIVYGLNFFRAEGISSGLTFYLFIYLAFWLIIHSGLHFFYRRQLDQPL